MARNICLPSTSGQIMVHRNSPYTWVSAAGILFTNGPYAPASAVSRCLSAMPRLPGAVSEIPTPRPESPAATLIDSSIEMQEPKVQGVEASLRMGSNAPYFWQLM